MLENRGKLGANLKLSLRLLHWCGNWPPRRDCRSGSHFYWLKTCAYIILVFATYLFAQLIFLTNAWGDLERMIAGSFFFMTNLCQFYKMLIVLAYRDRISDLIVTIELAGEFVTINANEEKIVERYVRRGLFHHLTYQSLGGISIVSMAIASITRIIRDGIKRLPIVSNYPYDIVKSPWFELMFIQQIIGLAILCTHNIALDTLVTNLINVTCCQLEILKYRIRKMGTIDVAEINNVEHPDDELVVLREIKNSRANEKLRSSIEHNNIIIRFKNEIQDIFGSTIFCQCLVNCGIICLAAFHISRMSEPSSADVMGIAVYLFGMVYQIFIYCWHGNELTLHSESVSLAAYSGNWWKFDARYKSTLRILMIRCRKPLILTVGRIMVLSLETFTSIIRMSYSLFTILQNMTISEV